MVLSNSRDDASESRKKSNQSSSDKPNESSNCLDTSDKKEKTQTKHDSGEVVPDQPEESDTFDISRGDIAENEEHTFKVEESTGPYRPIKRSPSLDIDTRYPTPGESKNSHYWLLIEERAMRTISEHVGWGKDIEVNQVEQGGILVGSAIRDPESEVTYGIATVAVPATEADGSMTHLHFDHDTWKSILNHVDTHILPEIPDAQIIGWYHTHPGHLSVFMSGTDCATQRRMFAQDWHFAVVMNPQQEVWRVFHGAESEECEGVILYES